MNGIWIAPASNKDSKVHMDLTVVNTFEGKRFWGFENKHEKKYNNLQIGDTLVFYQNKKLTYKAKIKNKYESVNDSMKFWPASTEERNWPLIVELTEPQSISVDVKIVNAALGYKENSLFQGNTYFDQKNIKTPILFDLISEIYAEAIVEDLKDNVQEKIEVTYTKPNKTPKSKNFNVDAIMATKRKTDDEKTFKSQQKNGFNAEKVILNVLLEEFDNVQLMRDTNDRSPFDIVYTDNGIKTFVEVKGTSSPNINTDFYMSSNEVQFAEYCFENNLQYKLFRVYDLKGTPKYFEVDMETILDDKNAYLMPDIYRINMSTANKA